MHRLARSAGRGNKARRPDVEMTILEKIPAALQGQLEDLLDEIEDIKIVISTDLQFNGTYGKDWVLATEKRLLAFNQNGAPTHEVQSIELEAIEEIEIRELHGNNFMKVRTSDGAFEVARYSKRFAPKFAEAAPEIESLIDKVKPESAEKSRRHRKYVDLAKKKIRCAICGRPIPRWSDVCPNCVENKICAPVLAYFCAGTTDYAGYPKTSIPLF